MAIEERERPSVMEAQERASLPSVSDLLNGDRKIGGKRKNSELLLVEEEFEGRQWGDEDMPRKIKDYDLSSLSDPKEHKKSLLIFVGLNALAVSAYYLGHKEQVDDLIQSLIGGLNGSG